MTSTTNTTYAMTARNTFTAICFRSEGRGKNRNEILDVVAVDGGKIGSVKPFSFLVEGKKSAEGGRSFVNVFGQIRDLIADRNTPVIGWGAEPGNRLRSLIEVHDIDIEYPVRYLDLQNSARNKMGAGAAENWQTVAAKLDVETNGKRQPSAVDCANIHFALERIDYRIVVARAFVTFIRSIMYDSYTPNAISTEEAKGLQSFLSVLTNDFRQFKSLKELVDKALDDDVIEAHESRNLMDELKKMESEYQSFIDSRR